MAARRKKTVRKRKKSGGGFPFRAILLILLVVETVWLAAFIWGTGSFIPQGIDNSSNQKAGWNQDKQRELEDLELQKMLAVHGSRGDSEAPAR